MAEAASEPLTPSRSSRPHAGGKRSLVCLELPEAILKSPWSTPQAALHGVIRLLDT